MRQGMYLHMKTKLLEIKNFTIELMGEYGLSDWSFEYDKSVRRYGLCNYNRRRISLSANLVELNSEAETLNTILHEIAHALTPRAGHGREWADMAKSIGCTGSRCYNSRVCKPQAKYRADCLCNEPHLAYRKSLAVSAWMIHKSGSWSCAKCGATLKYYKVT